MIKSEVHTQENILTGSLLALASFSHTRSQLFLEFAFNESRFSTSIWYQDVDLYALRSAYGNHTIDKLIFHIAAFEVIKMTSMRPDQLSFGPLSKFCTFEFKKLWNLYFKGVWGQWRYENNLPHYHGPDLIDEEPSGHKFMPVTAKTGPVRVLSFCGGGKDSLVMLKLLEGAGEPYSTLAYSHSIYGDPARQHHLIDGLLDTCAPVQRHRQWVLEDFMSSPVLALDNPNRTKTLCAAETPASVFAALPFVLSSGYSLLVLGNEKSADHGNMIWDETGEKINHQWGKSYEAEMLLHEYIRKELIENLHVGSMLKPINDTLIFEILKSDHEGFLYTHSCNVSKPWCKRCAKCAYVWINYMAFLPVEIVDRIFGENLLDIEENQVWFRQMLGLEGHTPFECVGQPDEARIAFELARIKGIKGLAMTLYEEAFPCINFAPLIDRYLEVDVHHSALPQDFMSKPISKMLEVAAQSRDELTKLLVSKEFSMDGLKSAICSIVTACQQEDVSTYRLWEKTPQVKKAFAAAQVVDFDAFYFALQYPQDQLVDGLLSVQFPGNAHEIRFLLKESQFIDRHICTLISAVEGRSCCADKTSTVMRAIAKFLQTGAPIAFNYSQEYTFHLPQKVFNRHDLTMQYFRSLQQLHAGNPEPFMQALRSIHEGLQIPQEASLD